MSSCVGIGAVQFKTRPELSNTYIQTSFPIRLLTAHLLTAIGEITSLFLIEADDLHICLARFDWR